MLPLMEMTQALFHFSASNLRFLCQKTPPKVAKFKVIYTMWPFCCPVIVVYVLDCSHITLWQTLLETYGGHGKL